MRLKSCMYPAMDYVDGLTVHFQAYLTDGLERALRGPHSLSVEDALLLAGAMISTIVAILNREGDVQDVKEMTMLYNKVTTGRPVYGADFQFEDIHELGYGGETLTAAERVEATEAKALNRELNSWWWEVSGACNDVEKLSEIDQTPENLRTAFLRHVSHHNVFRPPEDQLDFSTLNINFNPV